MMLAAKYDVLMHAFNVSTLHCFACTAFALCGIQCVAWTGHRRSVSCCRRLLASLLMSLLGCGGRVTWLLLLLTAEAARVVLRPQQVTLS